MALEVGGLDLVDDAFLNGVGAKLGVRPGGPDVVVDFVVCGESCERRNEERRAKRDVQTFLIVLRRPVRSLGASRMPCFSR